MKSTVLCAAGFAGGKEVTFLWSKIEEGFLTSRGESSVTMLSSVLTLKHLSPSHCLTHPAMAHNEVKNDKLITANRSNCRDVLCK